MTHYLRTYYVDGLKRGKVFILEQGKIDLKGIWQPPVGPTHKELIVYVLYPVFIRTLRLSR